MDINDVFDEVEEKARYLEGQGFSNDIANKAIRVIDELYAEGAVTYSSLIENFHFGLEGHLDSFVSDGLRLPKYDTKRKKLDQTDYVDEDRRIVNKMLDDLEKAGFLEKEQKRTSLQINRNCETNT